MDDDDNEDESSFATSFKNSCLKFWLFRRLNVNKTFFLLVNFN